MDNFRDYGPQDFDPSTPETIGHDKLLEYLQGVFLNAHEYNSISLGDDVGDNTPPSIGRYVFHGPETMFGNYGTEVVFLEPTLDAFKPSDQEAGSRTSELEDEVNSVFEGMLGELEEDEGMQLALEFLQMVPVQLHRIRTLQLPNTLPEPDIDDPIGEDPRLRLFRERAKARKNDIKASTNMVLVFETTVVDMPLTYFVIDEDGVYVHQGTEEETYDNPNIDGAIEAALHGGGVDEIETFLEQLGSLTEANVERDPVESPKNPRRFDSRTLIHFLSNNYSPQPKTIRPKE